MDSDLYFDEDADDDFSPDLQAQIDHIERAQNHRVDEQLRRRRHKLSVRRKLEDWADARRMRNDLDYIH